MKLTRVLAGWALLGLWKLEDRFGSGSADPCKLIFFAHLGKEDCRTNDEEDSQLTSSLRFVHAQHWPGSSETFRKIPTALVYSVPSPTAQPEVVAWGLEAKSMGILVDGGLQKCECEQQFDDFPLFEPRPQLIWVGWLTGFKLYLEPSALRDGVAAVDPRLPPLPVRSFSFERLVSFRFRLRSSSRADLSRNRLFDSLGRHLKMSSSTSSLVSGTTRRRRSRARLD